MTSCVACKATNDATLILEKMEENISNVLDTNQLEVEIQTGLSSVQMSDNSREAAKKVQSM